jgi:hypothetical protein
MSVHAVTEEVHAMQAFVTRFIYYHGERMPDANEVVMNYHTKIDIYRYYQKKASEPDFFNRHMRVNQMHRGTVGVSQVEGDGDVSADLRDLNLNQDVSFVCTLILSILKLICIYIKVNFKIDIVLYKYQF